MRNMKEKIKVIFREKEYEINRVLIEEILRNFEEIEFFKEHNYDIILLNKNRKSGCGFVSKKYTDEEIAELLKKYGRCLNEEFFENISF